MSMTNAFETNLLELLFNNTTLAGIGDSTGLVGSGAAGSLYVSLHTSDPGESGDQTTNETSYTNYARVAVARTSGGWTVAGNNTSNTSEVAFPQCGTTGATITHFGIGTDVSGTGNLLLSAALDSSRVISDGITPRFAPGELDVDAQ